ncbi:MAG: hypothetical protein R6V56_08510 [Lentisphaeria bacterium]
MNGPKTHRIRVIFLFSILAILGALPRVYGTLGISVQANRKSYVQYEKIKLTVTISNYTGNEISFASINDEQSQNHLTFSISENNGRSFHRVQQDRLLAGLTLEAGESRNVMVVANNLYNFEDRGEYLLNVQIGHYRLPNDYRSKPVSIRVRDGIELWSRQIGIPTADNDGPIPMREINLMKVQQDEEEVYCLRIEDDKNVYAVLRLGKAIRGADPQFQIDAISNIHVLLRLKSHLFVHKAYDYRGRKLQESYYMLAETKPELYRDSDDGTVIVVGGRQAVLGEDYTLTRRNGDSRAEQLPANMRRRPRGKQRLLRPRDSEQ